MFDWDHRMFDWAGLMFDWACERGHADIRPPPLRPIDETCIPMPALIKE